MGLDQGGGLVGQLSDETRALAVGRLHHRIEVGQLVVGGDVIDERRIGRQNLVECLDFLEELLFQHLLGAGVLAAIDRKGKVGGAIVADVLDDHVHRRGKIASGGSSHQLAEAGEKHVEILDHAAVVLRVEGERLPQVL